MSDALFIDRLETSCRIGATAKERAFPQPVFVSVRLEFPLGKAGETDRLRETIDYAVVCGQIRRTLESKTFHLVEAAAETVARLALAYEKVQSVRVRVEKKVLLGVESAGAEITRSKTA